MLNLTHQTRVFLFTEPVDMRKSFRGLCQLAESVLEQDPASGHWFAFINRHGIDLHSAKRRRRYQQAG